MLRAPGRNADAVAEITIALLFAVNRYRRARRPRRAHRQGVRRRQDPVPALSRLAARGPDRGHRRARRGRTGGASGASRASACGCSSYDPYNPDATHTTISTRCSPECDVVSMHAVVTPETEGLMGAEQFAAMKQGAIYINSARARAARHRRARRRARSRATSAAPASTTSRARTCRPTIRCTR